MKNLTTTESAKIMDAIEMLRGVEERLLAQLPRRRLGQDTGHDAEPARSIRAKINAAHVGLLEAINIDY